MVSQLEALRDHAANRGMKIIEEFTDAESSGLRLERPGLERMRDLAGHRGFDVLLSGGPDRLARNPALLVLLIEELEQYRIRTLFPNTACALGAKQHEITLAIYFCKKWHAP